MPERPRATLQWQAGTGRVTGREPATGGLARKRVLSDLKRVPEKMDGFMCLTFLLSISF